MPIQLPLRYAVYTIWVSLCAFAPELIWQGFVHLHHHFGVAEAASALFIGALFAFFVEPILERLRAGRWQIEHPHRRGLLPTALVSIVFGFAVVCLHEAIVEYLHAPAADDAGHASLSHAIEETLEWALIPAGVIAAWFVAGTWPRLALRGAAIAAAWSLAVGLFYGWSWATVITSSIPAALLAGFGARLAARRWDIGTFPELARLTAIIAASWLAIAWIASASARSFGWPGLGFYEPGALAHDVRFYLGWTLGLLVAPNPLDEE